MILEVELADWIRQEAFPSGFQNRFEKNESSLAECNMSTNSQGQLLELSTKKVLPLVLCSRFKPIIKQKYPKIIKKKKKKKTKSSHLIPHYNPNCVYHSSHWKIP